MPVVIAVKDDGVLGVLSARGEELLILSFTTVGHLFKLCTKDRQKKFVKEKERVKKRNP